MPSGSDFKYSTGDTTAWKTKYYAFVDYALSVGTSVADIEAFLAEHSDFEPQTPPTALASLNAVTATTSDNLEYQISHGVAYTSFAANLWFLVRMPSANTGAMTLKVDALAAKDVTVNGVATTGGEFAAGVVYLFSYNSASDRFDAFGPAHAADPPAIQVFTSSGTWTQPEGLRALLVIAVAGGGAGGSAGSGESGGGGGAGEHGFMLLMAASLGATVSVTIGAAGSPAASGNNSGGSGGTTSFGAHLSVLGGSGGEWYGDAGNGGSGGSGGTVRFVGTPGNRKRGDSKGSGEGGSSHFGAAGKAVGPGSHGGAASGYGAGGGGGSREGTGSNRQGGAGAPGLVFVVEIY